jgi:hypothetical protein
MNLPSLPQGLMSASSTSAKACGHLTGGRPMFRSPGLFYQSIRALMGSAPFGARRAANTHGTCKPPCAPTANDNQPPRPFHCPLWPSCGCPGGTVMPDCPGLEALDDLRAKPFQRVAHVVTIPNGTNTIEPKEKKMEKSLYGLSETVRMIASEEKGAIIGRAEYLHDETRYLVRYKAADGRQVEDWWGQSAIIRP